MNFKLAGKYKITTDESDSNYNLPSLFNNDESQDEFVDLVTRLGETNTSEVSCNENAPSSEISKEESLEINYYQKITAG